jgi:hypothetical protein
MNKEKRTLAQNIENQKSPWKLKNEVAPTSWPKSFSHILNIANTIQIFRTYDSDRHVVDHVTTHTPTRPKQIFWKEQARRD